MTRAQIMKFLLPLATASLALAGCTDAGFRGVTGVRNATEAEVASCRYVTTITMKPGVYGPVLADQGIKYARNKVLESAGQSGANTVVFDRVEPGGAVYLVSAKAYSC